MIRVLIILAAVVAFVPCYAQNVRVFSGGVEHVYGRGGAVLDSPELRARNKHAQRQICEESEAKATELVKLGSPISGR
jgi:hypothetical protein